MLPPEAMPLVGGPPPSHHLLELAREVMTNTAGPATAIAVAAAAAPSQSTESAEEAAVAGLGFFSPAPAPAAAETAPAKPPTVLSQGLSFTPVGGEGAGGSPRLSFVPVGRKRKSSSSGGGERAARAPKPPRKSGGGGGSSKPQPSMKFIAELVKSGAAISYAQSNPKREGSKSHALYEEYKAAATCAQALELGARRADLQFDLARGYFSIEAGGGGVDWSARLADELARAAGASGAAATAARDADGADDADVPGLAPAASAATTVDDDDDDDDDGMAAAAAARAGTGAPEDDSPAKPVVP